MFSQEDIDRINRYEWTCPRCHTRLVGLPTCLQCGYDPQTSTTHPLASKDGPRQSSAAPPTKESVLARLRSPEMRQKLSISLTGFIQSANEAFEEWNQDVGCLTVTEILLERDPDKITTLLKRVYQDGWMTGNLADRTELPKSNSGVKADFSE